jgi:hypothetical protein
MITALAVILTVVLCAAPVACAIYYRTGHLKGFRKGFELGQAGAMEAINENLRQAKKKEPYIEAPETEEEKNRLVP